jgi:hypothetical protein
MKSKRFWMLSLLGLLALAAVGGCWSSKPAPKPTPEVQGHLWFVGLVSNVTTQPAELGQIENSPVIAKELEDRGDHKRWFDPATVSGQFKPFVGDLQKTGTATVAIFSDASGALKLIDQAKAVDETSAIELLHRHNGAKAVPLIDGGDGNQYALGCLPMLNAGRLSTYQTAGQPIYTREQIKAYIAKGDATLKAMLWVILNQGQRGDCWAYSATQCLMVKLRSQYGEKILLDTSVGPVITGQYNGGAIDSMLLQVQVPIGQPAAEYMKTDPRIAKVNLNKSSWPKDWKTEAAKHKAFEGKWLQLTTPEELASAIICGHPASIGVSWQGGGHAICCLEVSLAADGSFDFSGPNSWSESFTSGWGAYGPSRPGWWKLNESRLGKTTFQMFGAYALCGVVDSTTKKTSDTSSPPAAVEPTHTKPDSATSTGAAVHVEPLTGDSRRSQAGAFSMAL